ADDMLEHLPAASRVGKTIVGGIDLNKARMRRVIAALIALSASPNGFTASELAARVRALGKQSPSPYGPRQETARQTHHPTHRPHPPLRAAPDRSQGDACAPR